MGGDGRKLVRVQIVQTKKETDFISKCYGKVQESFEQESDML